jgi:hypothetical protein
MKSPPIHFEDDWEDEPCPDHCEDKVPLGEYYHCHVCDREWLDIDDEETAQKDGC